MTLSQEQREAMRTLDADKRNNIHIGRIADALEDIRDELRALNERQGEGGPGEGRHPFAKA